MIKLYGFWRSLASCRVRIALRLKGVAFEEIPVDLMKGDQHADAYKAINPQAVVPSLVIDDDAPLFQSMAILEYLEETQRTPPLLPPDPRGRARVRGLAQIVVSDTHPLIVPRVRDFLTQDLGIDEAKRNRWIENWSMKGLQAVEAQLVKEIETARFCHGSAPTLADVCVVSQVFGAQLFGFDTSSVPAVMRIFGECMKIPAFEQSAPLKQPGAPAKVTH
ncbi:MAG TPA: maleylacetoacetate isomerase [Burkholderiales bacterium]|nr:maleylacetoacetate isomerase [Burkholderiales bacterium]